MHLVVLLRQQQWWWQQPVQRSSGVTHIKLETPGSSGCPTLLPQIVFFLFPLAGTLIFGSRVNQKKKKVGPHWETWHEEKVIKSRENGGDRGETAKES